MYYPTAEENITMGDEAREKGVLKLVHPGKYVEIHTEPISAAEVMKKNPRHCVTRPDVFEFPWIVVKPESVLKLGRVFFIVPNHTIYNLLKAREQQRNQPSPPRQRQSLRDCVHPRLLNQTSSINSYAGMKPKTQNRSQCHKQQLDTTSRAGASPQVTNCGKRFIKPSQVQCWPEMITKHKNARPEFKKKPLVDLKIDIRSSHDYYFSDSSFIGSDPSRDIGISAEWPKKEGALEFKCGKEVGMLKSCLRKQDSIRKLLHLRVSFVLPTKMRSSRGESASLEQNFAGIIIC